MKSKKVYISIVSVLLVITICSLGVYFGLYGITNQGDNFNEAEPDDNMHDIVAIDRLGNPILAGSTVPLQSFAYTCSQLNVKKSLIVEAQVEPDTTTDKEVEWSIQWSNPNSSFATSKIVTDYVRLVAQEDSTKCEIEYVQDFAEQVVLTATVKADNEIKADCTIDCCKKLKYKDYSWDYNTITIDLDYTTVYTVDYVPQASDVLSDCKIVFRGQMSESMAYSGIYDDINMTPIQLDCTINGNKLTASLTYQDAIINRYNKNGKTYDALLKLLSDNHYKHDIIIGLINGTIETPYYSFNISSGVLQVPYDTWRIHATGITLNTPSIKV